MRTGMLVSLCVCVCVCLRNACIIVWVYIFVICGRECCGWPIPLYVHTQLQNSLVRPLGIFDLANERSVHETHCSCRFLRLADHSSNTNLLYELCIVLLYYSQDATISSRKSYKAMLNGRPMKITRSPRIARSGLPVPLASTGQHIQRKTCWASS